MIRWTDTGANRLQPQEMALLALCDRMTMLEQAQTFELETQRQLITEQASRLAQMHDRLLDQRRTILHLEDSVRRLQATLRALK